MKSLTLVYYGVDGAAAKVRAAEIRKDKAAGAQLRHASAYGGEIEPCDLVEITADVSDFDRARIERAYGDRVKRPGVVVPPPPPPPPVNPLANLPANWQQMPPARLREIATSISGRTPENKTQAVEVIEAALAAK